MQKNLLLKTLFIIGVLLVFIYGIFGIPGSFSGQGLKESLLKRISLGLDLKGGSHLILQVQVDDAVNAETDHAAELLKEQLQKANVAYASISKPDPAKQPDQIVVKGIAPNSTSALRKIVTDNLQSYDLSGAGDTYTTTLKTSAESELKNRTVEQSIEAITRRVNTLGVSEPVVEEHGLGNYQILVQLPGVDDITRVKDILQSTARLELREALDHGAPYPSEPAAREAHHGLLPPDTVLMHGQKSVDDRGDSVFVVSRVPVVSGTDIKGAEAGHKGDTNAPIVYFYLTTSAGEKFARFTGTHSKESGNPSNLAIVLDNRVVEAPEINSEIHDSGIIEGGNFTEQGTRDLAMLLRSGALPASITYIQETTVGPSLGADSIRKGVEAAVAGMVAVMVFMLIYYRGAGINADLALFLNLVILLGFMGFSGATLTLPGIAGVILTVGMGVDSNVLIFERIREELRHGKAAAAAVDQGFARAWITIVDTHVTTIVSAFILFIFGTGPVKGFAVTLTFGLLANLFTAVFVSRVIFDGILSRKQRGEALSI
ncbi:MAG TPA: protein translocase subunit SecD [Candidatus Angelobacter sp.]